MQNAETVLGVLRERGRKGLPLDELYRQLFNPQLYLLADGRIYSSDGAMTPGVTQETADGMSWGKIGRIIDAVRHERYRFSPARRVWIPEKNGKLRPLGMPAWPENRGSQCACCWRRTASRGSPAGPTGSGPVWAAAQHWVRWPGPGPGRPGSPRVMPPVVSGLWITR